MFQMSKKQPEIKNWEIGNSILTLRPINNCFKYLKKYMWYFLLHSKHCGDRSLKVSNDFKAVYKILNSILIRILELNTRLY